MSSARRLLIAGGIALAPLGMIYGLWYAVFAEHQELDELGKSLATGFSAAAERKRREKHASVADRDQGRRAGGRLAPEDLDGIGPVGCRRPLSVAGTRRHAPSLLAGGRLLVGRSA